MPSIIPQALTDEIHAVRTGVGLWQRTDHTFVRITGPDAATWLHSQTTNDVEALASGQGHHNTVLDRQGRLQGHFTLHRWEDEFWMIIESSQADHVLKQLDDHLFIEDVQLEPTGDALEQLIIQGPESLAFLSSIMDTDEGIGSTNLPADPWGVHPVLLAGEELLAFRLSPTGEDGYLFLGEQGQSATVLESLLAADTKFQPKIISPEAREILRIEAGLPRFGMDMDTSNRLPETTLERTTVSYEKGCYIGQEVVARLKAYGTVKQALMGLVFEEDIASEEDSPTTHGRDAHAPIRTPIVKGGESESSAETTLPKRGMGVSPMEKSDLARNVQALDNPNNNDSNTPESTPETSLPSRGMGVSPMEKSDLTRNVQAQDNPDINNPNTPTSTPETPLPDRGMGVSPMNKSDLTRNVQAPSILPYDAITKKRGAYLPHWFQENATYFVTFRLAGSEPKNIIAEKKDMDWEEYDQWIHQQPHVGHLQNPDVAETVQNALLHFHQDRYYLFAWCIMPNHVHVVVKPEGKNTLPDIIHAWKSFTSHELNRLLNRKGSFWQSEYYDKLVRDGDQLDRFIEYTYGNTEQAGLHDWEWRGYNNPLDYYEEDSPSTHGRDAHAPIHAPIAESGESESISKTTLSTRGMGVSPMDKTDLARNVQAPIDYPCDIFIDNKRIGRITSTCQSPTLNAPIALAYLDRDHRTPGETFTFTAEPDGPAFTATVQVLPLYETPSRKDHAYTLYDRALDMFQLDLDDSDVSAIPLLKKAILLQPEFEDAYEVLGVILHRHHRVDEAIHYMRHLAKLNPDCLMAHTNLSVFYVAKGMIEEAEQEKALSAVIGMNQATSEREAKKLAQQERQRIQQEAEERIGMFEEVLEIDPDDPVATFGLGKAYVQLADYEKAIPHLQHATEVQKDFSAAYLDLGKCHEFLGNPDTARQAYTEGIAVASRKGDLMPLREMERRLKALDEASASTTG